MRIDPFKVCVSCAHYGAVERKERDVLNVAITTADGHVWWTRDIYQAASLICICGHQNIREKKLS